MCSTTKRAAYMKAWRARNRETREKAKAGGCIRCGEKHIACLDFHHRDPTEKDLEVANLSTSRARLLTEIAKCDVLCANCHRKLHWELNNPTETIT